MFYVGQKVVCIDDDFPQYFNDDGIVVIPKRNEIYEVREVCMFLFCGEYELLPAIRLVEIKNPIKNFFPGGLCEHPFWAGRFRPVVEKKTDISIFTEMLNTKQKELVE